MKALLEGIQDEELRRNPQFLAKVRQFLKENNLKTTPETTKPLVQQITKELPDFTEDTDDDTVDFRAN